VTIKKVAKMRQKLILYMMTLLTLLALVVSVEAETDDQIFGQLESPEGGETAADFSADYKQGYEDAAELYKPLATLDGGLQVTKILLDAFREAADDDGFMGMFADEFIAATAPVYNKDVAKYNEFVALFNSVIDARMAPGRDDLKFELAPFFY